MDKNLPQTTNQDLITRIRDIWEASRTQAIRTVNSAHVCANWLIGKQIVEAEQAGEQRAEYGKALLKSLSQQLTDEYGSGFSISSLKYMRSFYMGYPDLLGKGHALRDLSLPAKSDNWQPGKLHTSLSWTHYRTLLKVDRAEARRFYETEAINNGWSARQLERQINTLLFDRLLKSKDKDGVMQMAADGSSASRPQDIIKDPYVLEFLNLPEAKQWHEDELEQALLSQLQDFLLELGSGFAFVGRQVRLTLDGDHFYPDMVFYHVKLKCYVVVDLKLDKLSHADLGQMQLYVNYYDQEIAGTDDNPSIGLILCTEKNDAVVRYVLGNENQQIFASRYQLHLPTEEQLQQELRREMDSLQLPQKTSTQ
jgi:predicted nuclease of restriction endonuclease-like (RecB) superfamily